MKKAWLPALFAGLGGVVLIITAIAARSDEGPEAAAVRPARGEAAKSSTPSRTNPTSASGVVPSEPRVEAPKGSIDVSVIRARVQAMEERLQALEVRRDQLKAENEGLSREITVRQTEAKILATADWRVKGWTKLLGLTETQQDELRNLASLWAREDQSGRPTASTWRSREGELRSRLSAEQSQRLHETMVQQVERTWSYMGVKLGGVIGAPTEDHGRFQQIIGAPSIPNTALLREAHDANWSGLMRQASGSLRPHLPSDQATRLDEFVRKYN